MKLSDIVDISTGYSFRSKIKHEPDGGVKVIQMSDVDSVKGINWESLSLISDFNPRSDRYFLHKGDLIMVSKGNNLNAFLISENFGEVVPVNSFLILRCKNCQVLPGYLEWFLNSKRTQYYLKTVAAGTGIPNLSRSALEDLDIYLPSLQRQKIITQTDELKQKEIRLHNEIATKKENLIDYLLEMQVENWKTKY
jgi:restriction endonuclease S subunit